MTKSTMTKSTITREQLLEIIETDHVQCGEASYLARMALAAIDSEPVVFTDERNLHHIAVGRETSLIWGKQNSEAGDIPLYRHVQPALVVPEGYVLAPKKPTVDMICAVRDYVAPLAGLDVFEAAYMAMLQAVDTSWNPASEGSKD